MGKGGQVNLCNPAETGVTTMHGEGNIENEVMLHDVNGYMVVRHGVACMTLEFFGLGGCVYISLVGHLYIHVVEDKK